MLFCLNKGDFAFIALSLQLCQQQIHSPNVIRHTGLNREAAWDRQAVLRFEIVNIWCDVSYDA